MPLTFDAAKDASNRHKHGISLSRLADMPEATSIVFPAKTVGEESRVKVIGPIDGRLYVGVVTYRGTDVRVISLRPASRTERRNYVEAL